MIDLGAVGDLGFVVAAYGVILGAVGLYAVTLARRLRRAREAASLDAASSADLAAQSGDPTLPADHPA